MTSNVLAENRPQILVCGIALALAICFVYSGVLDHGFVGYDDGDYVATNPQVLGGLSTAGVEWAFSTGHAANWHPLTWLSHMLDVELFGVDPGRMAAMNVAIHIAVCLLLLLLLVEWTGALWPAFAATLVFALHPQRVESVAWIAERKDVLAAFFFLPACGALSGGNKLLSPQCTAQCPRSEARASKNRIQLPIIIDSIFPTPPH